MPRAYLIDASIYVFRSWHVLPDTLTDAEGHPANAVYGFADFLLQLIEQTSPSHLACAFDLCSGGNWRREVFAEYKANRPPAPEELKRQFALCRELVATAGLAGFGSPRYEADDIIGTLSRHLRRHGFHSTLVTGDKDLTQLIRDGDEWWEFTRNQRLDGRGIEKKWGVPPEQVADLLALVGDKVDNIAGIPGIGPKTAANLLKKFGDLDGVLANIDGIGEMKFRSAKRIENLVRMHQDAARLARQLTVIADDPEVPDNPEALQPSGYDAVDLSALFQRLGFSERKLERWERALSQYERL
jgi:5'-3' exonuclease